MPGCWAGSCAWATREGFAEYFSQKAQEKLQEPLKKCAGVWPGGTV